MWKAALAIIGGIILVGLIVYFVVTSFPTFSPAPQEEDTNDDLIAVSSIAEDTVVFENLTVTVEGELVDWVTKRSFSIGGNAGFIGGGSVLVVRKDEYKLPQDTPNDQVALGEEGVRVRVTGTVRRFNLAQAQEELGVDLLDEELSSWEGRPVLIATSTQKIE